MKSKKIKISLFLAAFGLLISSFSYWGTTTASAEENDSTPDYVSSPVTVVDDNTQVTDDETSDDVSPSIQMSVMSSQSNTDDDQLVHTSAVSSWWDSTNLGKTKKVYSSWSVATASKASNASGTLSYSKSFTSSNSWTGTLKITKAKLDATVGFNTTKSVTSTSGFSVSVKPHKSYKIYYRRVYQQYKVKQQKVYYDNWSGKFSYGDTVYVYPKKYQYIEFKAVAK